MKDFLEIRTPLFRPLVRRVFVAAVLGAWTVVEISNGAWGWATVFGAATLYVAWAFFIAFEDGPAGKGDRD